MLIRVIETTDEQYIGLEFNLPSPGDVLKLGDVVWPIEGVSFDEASGCWKIWNFNYCAYVEEVKSEE